VPFWRHESINMFSLVCASLPLLMLTFTHGGHCQQAAKRCQSSMANNNCWHSAAIIVLHPQMQQHMVSTHTELPAWCHNACNTQPNPMIQIAVRMHIWQA
jgi:hypothetical protein